jgi:hypothetical protein
MHREPLQDLFFRTADRAMRDAGWASACDLPYVIAPAEGRYFRASEGLLVSVANVYYDGPDDDPPTPDRYAEAFVGVTFPAAERVLSALGVPYDIAVVDDAGVAAGGPELSKPIGSERDVEAAVVEAVALIEAGAPRAAQLVPDVDALIAALVDDSAGVGLGHYQQPAILAAAGRTDEARQALERMCRAPGTATFGDYCDRLEAFLRAGAPVPPPSEHAFAEVPTALGTTMYFGWSDIEPGHRLKAAGLMVRLLARRIVRPRRRGAPGDDVT